MVRFHLRRFEAWAISFTPLCPCLSEETLKAVGPNSCVSSRLGCLEYNYLRLELLHYTYFTHLILLAPSSTMFLHLTLFWARALASCQVTPTLSRSCSVERLQLIFGLPCLLFPCACLVVFVGSFLSVWPIQLHFLLLIVVFISSCLVFFQSSLFDILLGHHTLRMYQRRLLMKTWSLLLRD